MKEISLKYAFRRRIGNKTVASGGTLRRRLHVEKFPDGEQAFTYRLLALTDNISPNKPTLDSPIIKHPPSPLCLPRSVVLLGKKRGGGTWGG